MAFPGSGKAERMSDKTAVIAVYDPPKPDLPHIAVVIYPDGEVTGIAAYSAAAAADIVRELAVKVGANIADDDVKAPGAISD